MKRSLIIAGGYAVLLLVVFNTIWRGTGFFGWDCLREYWPDLIFGKHALAAGELPLWNPYALGGYAFWGDPQAGIFAPATWICWILGWITGSDGAWLIQVKVLLNMWIGLCGMHALVVRRFAVRAGESSVGAHAAGFVAAVVFVFGSPLLVHKNGAYLWPWLYLPWAIWALERFVESPTARRAAALALAVGLCGSAGHPQAFFYDLLIIGAYWLYLLASKPARILEELLGFGVFAVLAAMLLLPVYLPALQAVAASPRSHRGLDYVLQQPMPPRALVELLLPNIDDNWMTDIYVGPIALLLGVYAIVAVRGEAMRQRIFWLLLAIFGIVLALGAYGHVLPFLAAHVPGFGLFRIAYRHKLIFGFAIAVLAGDGVGSLVRGEGPASARFGVPLFAVVWIVGALYTRFCVYAAPSIIWAVLFGGDALVLASVAAVQGSFRRWLVVAMAAFTMADLYAAGKLKLEILQPPPVLAADAPLLARMPGVDGAWRYQNDTGVPYHVAYLNQVRELSGFSNPVQLERQETLESHADTSVDLLEKLNVRYIWGGRRPSFAHASGKGLYELEHPVALARVYPRAETLSTADVLARMLAPDPLSTVLVEAADAPADLPAGDFAPVDGQLTDYRRNRIEVDVDAPAAGILVLNESFYPGWTAEVAGQATPVFRADYLLRAVSVPAGKSHVIFRYSPRSLWPLFIGFLLALAVVMTLQLRKVSTKTAASKA